MDLNSQVSKPSIMPHSKDYYGLPQAFANAAAADVGNRPRTMEGPGRRTRGKIGA